MEGIVASEDVQTYRCELENGVEQPKREILLRLLVEEFGFTHEQLGKLDRHIARLAELMARQVELVDGFTLRDNSIATRRAKLVLATMNDIMVAYIARRHEVAAALAVGSH